MKTLPKKKRGPGRPKNPEKQIRIWHTYGERTLSELDVLVSFLDCESPPYSKVDRRTVIAALIHRAASDGELSFSSLFGVQ